MVYIMCLLHVCTVDDAITDSYNICVWGGEWIFLEL